jgi:hypothetical protein
MCGDVARALAPAADASAATRRSPAFERRLSAVEAVVLVSVQLAVVWFGLWLLALPWFMPVARVFFSAEFLYLIYLSPVWLHRDPLPERGLGTWRTLFVRTDNLRTAARGFGWLTLGGSAAILILAATWNAGWTTRLDWQAFWPRARHYSISVVVQTLVFVGFALPRVKRLLARASRSGLAAESDALPRRLLMSAVVAALFCALHAPHPLLMALAAAYGFALAWLSLRTPNVLAAGCCQFLLGLQVYFVLGLSMRVGIFSSHPDVRFLRDVFSWIDRAIGNLR